MLADPQSALFYPVNLLHLVGPLPFMVMLVALLHLWWGAFGMARLARAFQLGNHAGLVAGMAWALSGYVASLWTNGARLPSAAWIPWQVLLSVHLARAARARRYRLPAVAWLAAANAMGFLAGDFFVAVMGELLGFAIAVPTLLVEGQDVLSMRRQPTERRAVGCLAATFAGLSATAVGLAALLSAVAVMPAARALAETERTGGLAAALAEAGSFHPGRLAGFAAPEAFARAWYPNPGAAWVGRCLDGAPLSLSVYVGGSVLALLVLAFAPLRQRRPIELSPKAESDEDAEPSRRTAVALAVVAALFLLISFGHYTPLFAVLRALLPPIAYMRAPEKWLLTVVPCLALLAGWGAHRMTTAAERPSWRWGLIMPGLILLLVLLAPAMFPPDLGRFVQVGAWHGLLAATAVLVAWPLGRRWTGLAGGLLLLLVVADLALGTSLTLRFSNASALRRPLLAGAIQPLSPPPLPFPRLFRGGKVQLSASQSGAFDSDDVTLETMRDNISVPFGIVILPGYGVATPPALPALLERGRLDALRLLGTEYALLSAPQVGQAVPEGLALVSTALPGVRLSRVERALPRVFVSFAAKRLRSTEISHHLLDAEVVAGRVVLLDHGEPWNGAGQSTAAPVPCHIDDFTNLRVRATCTTDYSAGLAVFVEQYAHGWHAQLDGAPAPLLRANTVMRAVAVPAGKHIVTLVFTPPGLRAGALLSLFGLLATAALLVGPRLRARLGIGHALRRR
jgi:hypothetical protein